MNDADLDDWRPAWAVVGRTDPSEGVARHWESWATTPVNADPVNEEAVR